MSRIILPNHHLLSQILPETPEETFGFICFVDFSVGPLSKWKNPSQFRHSRSELDAKTPLLTLPDGKQMNYFMWHQFLPGIDIARVVEREESELPKISEFEDLIPNADVIEIWANLSVPDQVWQWYLLDEFTHCNIASTTRQSTDPISSPPSAAACLGSVPPRRSVSKAASYWPLLRLGTGGMA